MVNWTTEDLLKLKIHHEEELKIAEDAIENSSYPPDEQREIDINEHIIQLLRHMMDEKSWICKNFLNKEK
jgi:hypothetical protein